MCWKQTPWGDIWVEEKRKLNDWSDQDLLLKLLVCFYLYFRELQRKPKGNYWSTSSITLIFSNRDHLKGAYRSFSCNQFHFKTKIHLQRDNPAFGNFVILSKFSSFSNYVESRDYFQNLFFCWSSDVRFQSRLLKHFNGKKINQICWNVWTIVWNQLPC